MNITPLAIIITGIMMGLAILWSLQIINKRKKILYLDSNTEDTKNKLQEQQNLFETIFNTTGIGIALLNLEGRFLRMNASLSELLGYSQKEMLAMNYYNLIHPNDIKL